MRSYEDLLEASGYAHHPQEFEALIEILDSQVRLITPTEPEGIILDTVSLFPYLEDPGLDSLRHYNYADYLPFTSADGQYEFAIRNARYKLIESQRGSELYDLDEDPYERDNLMGTQGAYNGWLNPEVERILFQLRVDADRLRSGIPGEF